MYISFPKFSKGTDKSDLPFNNRFFKKMFYNYTREMYEFSSEDYEVLENSS